LWREARPDDHVCVTPETRAQTASENRQAANYSASVPYDLGKEEQVFTKPKLFDRRLDWCLNWGAECGRPAADNWCKRKLFTGARDFEADPNIGRSEQTLLSGSNQVCNQSFCTGFKFITCYGRIPWKRTRQNPVWKGYRLDLCLTWGTNCGKPAADAYCRNQGFSDSFYYVADSDQSLTNTRLIGTDQICDKNFWNRCRGFGMIVCQ
jgi:hypothetical protein